MSLPDVALVPLMLDGAAEIYDSAVACETARLSAWSGSRAKRIFDCVVVIAFAPAILPLLLALAAIVRLSSPGPVLFRQTRIGLGGRLFTIFKFRTMLETPSRANDEIASAAIERITPVGRILRRLKLDELPQLVNVLRGEMSLVGPRPRVAGQQLVTLRCRPGVTGAATLAFAREELLLVRIPQNSLARFYRETVLPAKHRLDDEYMARATMLSDLRVLLLTVLGRWPSPHAALSAPHACHAALKAPSPPLPTLQEIGATAPQD